MCKNGKYITFDELSKIIGVCYKTLNTYLCRAEFAKYTIFMKKGKNNLFYKNSESIKKIYDIFSKRIRNEAQFRYITENSERPI